MLAFSYKKSILKITEHVGPEISVEKVDPDADVLVNMELLFSSDDLMVYNKFENSVYLLLPNYIIDLEQPEEVIFKNINKSTRRNINKAMKSETFKFIEHKCPTDEQIDAFSLFYNKFAKEVNIKKCDKRKLKSIRDKGALIITYITDETDEVLCSHAHFCNNYQSFGIYSAIYRYGKGDSYTGQLVGRANKLLDWKNILNAKKRGCKWYNFGGKITNPNDAKGQNVNRYKSSFGSVNGYDLRIYTANSFYGKLFLLALHFYFKRKRSLEYAYTKQILYRTSDTN